MATFLLKTPQGAEAPVVLPPGRHTAGGSPLDVLQIDGAPGRLLDLDVAADAKNAKCEHYIDEDMDGLKQPWSGVAFCNPPYGRDVDKWVAKAVRETLNGVTTVMLLPARTDVQWFHKYIYNRFETRFIRGRLKFVGAGSSAPFPSMIVVFPGIDLP